MTSKPIPRTKINYASLSSKAKEIYNQQKLSAVLADYGLQLIPLADDVDGADFILKDPAHGLHSVQLKSRITIAKKYLHNPYLYIAFPDHRLTDNGERIWYLVLHTELIDILKITTGALKTKSWREDGLWSADTVSKDIRNALAPHAFPAT